MIHVICYRPGLIRGGRSNPRYASYAPTDISAEQLLALANDPDILVIEDGRRLTSDDFDVKVSKKNGKEATTVTVKPAEAPAPVQG